jgi:hypothetical protein
LNHQLSSLLPQRRATILRYEENLACGDTFVDWMLRKETTGAGATPSAANACGASAPNSQSDATLNRRDH